MENMLLKKSSQQGLPNACDLVPNSVGSSYEEKDFFIAVPLENCRPVYGIGMQGIHCNNCNCFYFCCCSNYSQSSFAWCYYQTVYVRFVIANVAITSGFSMLVGCHFRSLTSLPVSMHTV